MLSSLRREGKVDGIIQASVVLPNETSAERGTTTLKSEVIQLSAGCHHLNRCADGS